MQHGQDHVDVAAVIGQRQQKMLHLDREARSQREIDACELRLAAIQNPAVQGGHRIRLCAIINFRQP